MGDCDGPVKVFVCSSHPEPAGLQKNDFNLYRRVVARKIFGERAAFQFSLQKQYNKAKITNFKAKVWQAWLRHCFIESTWQINEQKNGDC